MRVAHITHHIACYFAPRSRNNPYGKGAQIIVSHEKKPCNESEADELHSEWAIDETMRLAVRTRRQARCGVLRILYALDSLGQLDNETVEKTSELVFAPVGEGERASLSDSISFARTLLFGALKNVLEVDRLVQQSSEHWTLARICRIDRNILRMAVYEIINFKDTPVSVIINEAVEIAKLYAAPDAASFINGVLDHAAKAIRGVEQPVKAVS